MSKRKINIMKKQKVQFYVTSKRELKFELEFYNFEYKDWVENQSDSDVEQVIFDYYDKNSEEIEFNLEHKPIND
jgi:hypothetical protein